MEESEGAIIGNSGKTKNDLEQKKREIFIRNLTYDTTSEELIELFQEIGPIKRASIVEKDGVSRGFGFVKFAIEEDAQTAIRDMNGREFKGRRLIIETAVLRGQNPLLMGLTETNVIKVSKSKPVTGSKVAPVIDPKIKKLQLVVFGVSEVMGKKIFRTYLKTISKKAAVTMISSDHALYEWVQDVRFDFSDVTARELYTPLLITASDAIDCQKILDHFNTPGFNGILLRKLIDLCSETEKEVLSKASPIICVRALKHITEPRLRKRHCRLIVRNLSFQANECNVASKLSTFGPLTEVTIPKVEVEKSTNRRNKENNSEAKLKSRGFAFVTFLCENDAKSAVENCSKLKICNREFALDFCESKDRHATNSATDAESVVPLVDTGLKEESKLPEKEGEKANESEDSSVGNSDVSAEDNVEGSAIDVDTAVEKPKAKVISHDVKEGCTIFIRDIPFDAVAQDVRAAFRPFGKITMCLLVQDKDTGMSKGSAFVKFDNCDSAEQAVNSAAFTGGSVLGPVYVKGKPVRVDIALERDQAKRLDENKAVHGHRVDGGKDKRNLYLSNEGLGVGSVLEADMPEADVEKRKRAHQEKRKKLQNPLFFVSATRLCVRNLKKSVTEEQFRDLCIKATKAGLANGLVTPTDIDMQLCSQGLSIRERPAEALIVPNFSSKCTVGKKGTWLKNMKSKIMRDTTRVKGAGEAPSRGYGFVEFGHHGHALACLRELNNNVAYCDFSMSHANQDPGKRPRLIVEFSLEDTRKVNLLKKRMDKVGKKAEQPIVETDEVDSKLEKSQANGNKKKKVQMKSTTTTSKTGDDSGDAVLVADIAKKTDGNCLKGRSKKNRKQENVQHSKTVEDNNNKLKENGAIINGNNKRKGARADKPTDQTGQKSSLKPTKKQKLQK